MAQVNHKWIHAKEHALHCRLNLEIRNNVSLFAQRLLANLGMFSKLCTRVFPALS